MIPPYFFSGGYHSIFLTVSRTMATPIDSLDDEKMQAVLKHCRVKASWNDVKSLYKTWESVYKHEHHKTMTVEDLMQVARVFRFKGVEIQKCRNEFINWLSQNKEFYHDDVKVIYSRMKEALHQRNVGLEHPVPYINWLPEYGECYTPRAGRTKN